MAMISASFGRSALHAVMTRSLGSEAGSTTREWYRMPVTGLGTPSNSSSSSWITSHVFPCMRRSAGTKRLADRLMTEAHAQDRQFAGQGFHERHEDAGLARRARARRHHGGGGLEREDLLHGQRIVAVDHGLRPELAEQLDEVVGEGVVVVEDEEHAGI